jgi:hypothetical protein
VDSTPLPPNSKPWKAKLTEERVKQILVDGLVGVEGRRWSTNALAKREGVSWPTIRDILEGRTWRHLPRPGPVPEPEPVIPQPV